MSARLPSVVGLDIGTSKITVVIADAIGEGKIEIVGVGRAESRGLRKGVVINIDSTVQAIAKAIHEAEVMSGRTVSRVYASISGSHVRGMNSQGVVGIRSKEVKPFDVEKVIEAAKAVAIPMDREVIHVLPQEFIVDEQDGIKDPLGISGVRLEARIHIVTGAVASAQNVVKCANRCGLTVEDIVLSSLASARSSLSLEEQELGVCLLDVGGGTVEMAVFHQGAVKFTCVLPIGGNRITGDIAAGLRTPVVAAEELKRTHGSAVASAVDREETIEVLSTGKRSARVLSKLVLAEIIEPRVMEMFQLIRREIEKNNLEDILTGGVVLTGGCSKLDSIVTAAERALHLPVRLGFPGAEMGLGEAVALPECATAVGLALHASHSSAVVRSLTSASYGGPVNLVRRAQGWLKRHF